MKTIDYSDQIDIVMKEQQKIKNSMKQYEQIFAPKESFVIERLRRIKGISNISAVTEDNDPNSKLNKAGGYTSQIFFSSDLVDQSKVEGDSTIEKATKGGGSVEVYKTVEDAKKRNTYFDGFDGTIFDSGSHVVIGTIIVRTSRLLKASEQEALETNIIEVLKAPN